MSIRSQVPTDAQRIALRGLLGLLVTMVLACGTGEPALELADFVDFQRDQVSTRLISAPEQINLDRMGFGWRFEETDNPQRGTLLMDHRTAAMTFFAAEGEVTGIEFEASIRPGAGAGSENLRVSLNREPMEPVRLTSQLDRYRLEFPHGSVRPGLNFLNFRQQGRGAPGSAQLSLRWLRFLEAEARGGRTKQGARVTVDGTTVTLPGSSYLDAVFVATPEARFEAKIRATGRVGLGPIVAEVTLLGPSGAEQVLSREELQPTERARLGADLTGWAGEYVRVRLAVSGPAGTGVEWQNPRVRGVRGLRGMRGTDERVADPLGGVRIAPEIPPQSDRLIQSARRPDVILVMLDAARFDAFSCYGNPHTTPVIDSLAADGTRFSRALAPSSWTGQAVPTILTSLYPDVLGVEQWTDPLPTEIPTLAELFADAGYRTLLWSQHPIYGRWPSLARGFDLVEVPGIADLDVFPNADELLADDRPTFAFIHLLPPHAPYDPPAPFRGRLTSWYKGGVKLGAGFLHSFEKKQDPASLDANDRRYIWERYLENVAFADSLVGRIVQILRDEDRYDQALIGVLSDHGEAFLEHDRFLHSGLLHQEFIQVPLVIKWPAEIAGAARVVDQAVTTADLLPTLADGLALEIGSRGFQGRSLLPMVFDDLSPERWHYAVTSSVRHRGLFKLRMMIEWREWKLHYDPISEIARLYRIDTDPGEQHDLAAQHPTLALYLRQEVLRQRSFNLSLVGSDATRDREQSLDAETIEQLKALGYLGGD